MSAPSARRVKAKIPPSAAIVSATAPPAPQAGGSVSSANLQIGPEKIAMLAHSYWEARGCQGGSPEEDWLRAERQLRNGN